MGEGGATVPILPSEESDIVLQRSAQQHMTLGKDVLDWTSEEVGNWLYNVVGLPKYRQVFVENHISGGILLKLDRESLKELVPSVGHRVMLLESLSKIAPSFELRLGAPATSQYASQLQQGWQSTEVKGPMENLAVTCAMGPTAQQPTGHVRMDTGQQEGDQPNDSNEPHGGIEMVVLDGHHTMMNHSRLDSDESELLENQPIKMNFIDRIRYVHNEYISMRSQDLKADRMWRREVCKKIGLRIEESKLADSLRWHDNLFQIAFRDGEIWDLQEKIFSKWERWEIKGQKEAYHEHPGSKRRRRNEPTNLLRNPECDSPPGMPLLPWRALQGLTNKVTLKNILQQVADGQLSMKEMEEQGSNLKSLERMRTAFVDLSQSASWQHCAERFPPFITDHQLSAFLKDFQKKRSNEERRQKPGIPETFVAHVQNAMVWEEHSGRLSRQGDAHDLSVLQGVPQAHLQPHHRLATGLRHCGDTNEQGGYVTCSDVHLEHGGVLDNKCREQDNGGQFEAPSRYKPVMGGGGCLVTDDGLNLP